jgi:preprotein translocase subunit Sss1
VPLSIALVNMAIVSTALVSIALLSIAPAGARGYIIYIAYNPLDTAVEDIYMLGTAYLRAYTRLSSVLLKPRGKALPALLYAEPHVVRLQR